MDLLRSKLIKLAADHPEFQEHLIPLLTASEYRQAVSLASKYHDALKSLNDLQSEITNLDRAEEDAKSAIRVLLAGFAADKLPDYGMRHRLWVYRNSLAETIKKTSMAMAILDKIPEGQ